MRHSTEPRFKKYVKGYGFLSFALNFADKYGKKLMDTATKTGIDANVNRLFVLLFQRIVGENNAAKGHRDSFSDYYIPKVEIRKLENQNHGAISSKNQKKQLLNFYKILSQSYK